MKNKASCPWGCSKQKKRKRTANRFLSKDSLQEGENKNRGCILGEGYCIINLVESRGWRHSSAGRALASHARGHWFESSRLHHVAPSDTNTGSRKAWLVCFAALALLLRKKARLRSREKTFARPSLGFPSPLAYHFFAVLCIHSKFQIC